MGSRQSSVVSGGYFILLHAVTFNELSCSSFAAYFNCLIFYVAHCLIAVPFSSVFFICRAQHLPGLLGCRAL